MHMSLVPKRDKRHLKKSAKLPPKEAFAMVLQVHVVIFY